MISRLSAVLPLALALAGCGPKPAPTPAPEAGTGGKLAIGMIVPCGLVSPFLGLKTLYEGKHADTLLNVDYYCTDALTERILKHPGVPDLHVSNGHLETDLLVKAGFAEPGAPVALGTFQLVLAANNARTGTALATLQDLAKPEIRRIVLGSTETSSLDAYAQRALEKLGLWDTLQAKIAYLPTDKECYAQLTAGKADAGFAYIGASIPADPAQAAYSKVKAVQTVPDGLFGGAVAFATVLKGAAHPKEAAALVEFLKTPEAQALLHKAGLQPLPEKL